jgi:hypothetical protein
MRYLSRIQICSEFVMADARDMFNYLLNVL